MKLFSLPLILKHEVQFLPLKHKSFWQTQCLLISFVVFNVLVVVPNSHQYPSWHSSLPEKIRKENRNHSLFCGLKLKNKNKISLTLVILVAYILMFLVYFGISIYVTLDPLESLIAPILFLVHLVALVLSICLFKVMLSPIIVLLFLIGVPIFIIIILSFFGWKHDKIC